MDFMGEPFTSLPGSRPRASPHIPLWIPYTISTPNWMATYLGRRRLIVGRDVGAVELGLVVVRTGVVPFSSNWGSPGAPAPN